MVVCYGPSPPLPPSEPSHTAPALSKRETLSHTAQGELQDASATSREEAQKRKGGTKTARFLLVRSLFGLSWKEKEQLHKTEGMTACDCKWGLGRGMYCMAEGWDAVRSAWVC